MERQRTFSGADLVPTLVVGWLTHPDARRETLASTARIREVSVSETAVQNRCTESGARFLHAVGEEMVTILVPAEQPVPLELLHRFSGVVLEESRRIAFPKELAEQWQGCGGAPGEGQAAVKLHGRGELKQGQWQGPKLTPGRIRDRSSPFKHPPLPVGS